MPRIKITGYLEIEPEEVDTNDRSGLTAAAYDDILGPESLHRLSALEDPESELVEE